MSSNQQLCNRLSIEQWLDNSLLAGPYEIQLDICNQRSIYVMQCGKRTIELSSDCDISADEMYYEFQSFEKLIMLFDGRFYPIKKISLGSKSQSDEKELAACSKSLLDNRLGYYSSKVFCNYHFLKLLNFHSVLTDDIYSKWKNLLKQMDISYQVFLYALSDNRNPVDMNLAFLIELAEPFVELIKENTFYCQTLTPGERGTTLKMCIDSIITHFGTDIFAKELSTGYSDFLDNAVGSRVRIMHIKKNQMKYWNGKQCVLYSMKFSLLYRRILIELLGIPFNSYNDILNEAIKIIDERFQSVSGG